MYRTPGGPTTRSRTSGTRRPRNGHSRLMPRPDAATPSVTPFVRKSNLLTIRPPCPPKFPGHHTEFVRTPQGHARQTGNDRPRSVSDRSPTEEPANPSRGPPPCRSAQRPYSPGIHLRLSHGGPPRRNQKIFDSTAYPPPGVGGVGDGCAVARGSPGRTGEAVAGCRGGGGRVRVGGAPDRPSSTHMGSTTCLRVPSRMGTGHRGGTEALALDVANGRGPK